MTFLYPSFLWALTALAIPVIIHLFNFRKTTRIYFSSNRFLKQVQEATSAKRKLKHYLILASRLLFIAFLVFAFAQPIIPAQEQFSNNRNVTLYVDNSLSMSVPVEEKTRALDAAIQYAKDIIETLPADTRFRLITNDFAPFSNTFKAKPDVLDLLAQVRLSPVSRTMEEVAQRTAVSIDAQSSGEVFWITDFQQATIGKLDATLYDTTQRWHFIPLTHITQANVFIDSAWLENPFVVGGEKNTLFVRLRNDGDKAVEQLLVKLTINAIQSGTSSVNVPAGGMTETSFDLTSGLTNINKATISFNDFPVAFDNEFYLTLNFSDKINVIEIKDQQAPGMVANVFGNTSVFNFRSYTTDNFNYSLLEQTDFVVLHAINKPDPALVQAVRAYVQRGGTLLLIPGAKPDLPTYTTLTGITLSKVDSATMQELDRPDFDNPFFENVFEERTTRLTMPTAKQMLRWSNRDAILTFKNNQPYLSRVENTGTLYLLSSPLSREYSTLAANALFVPVMYRMASSAKKSETKTYYTLNETLVTLRIDSLSGEEPLKLIGSQEVVPAQRRLNDRVVLELPRFTMQAGFYKAVSARDTLSALAFNLDPRESQLRAYTAAAVREQLGNATSITIFESISGEAFSNEIKARYLGKPLWKYALAIALLFLLVEVMLIRFMK